MLANDTDADASDVLTVSAVDGQAANVGAAVAGTYGTLTLDADGSYTYSPNAAAQQPGAGETGQRQLHLYRQRRPRRLCHHHADLTITGANDGPVAAADAATTAENASASGNVLANDTDADGAMPTVSRRRPGANVGSRRRDLRHPDP